MATDDEDWTRADWARWFVHRDEVDEAARVLEPGDEVVLGRSDFLNLAEALARRGLSATYDLGRALIHAPENAETTEGRRPPVRAGATASTQARNHTKKTA
jgi:hypothetical protein